jgi:hypothetical protein
MDNIIMKSQSINVRRTIIEWLAADQAAANSIIYGIGAQERHTAHRLNSIMAAHQEGKELPAIQIAPQFGQVIDGRHRLAIAYLMGIETIKADLHFIA